MYIKQLYVIPLLCRSVRDTKGWLWYKHPDQLKEYQLEKWSGEVMCQYKQCKHLPSLDKKAYDMHYLVAHQESDRVSNEVCK